jgi:hypothetical protein
VITLAEREHDQWARAYMCAVLRRDRNALVLLTNVDPCRESAWGRLDAVAACARDVIAAVAGVDIACSVISQRLLREALASASPGEDAG